MLHNLTLAMSLAYNCLYTHTCTPTIDDLSLSAVPQLPDT